MIDHHRIEKGFNLRNLGGWCETGLKPGDKYSIEGCHQLPAWKRRYPKFWYWLFKHARWLIKIIQKRQPLQVFEVPNE
jgi:hypothetical protein